MTRKDYKLLAEYLRKGVPVEDEDYRGYWEAVGVVADALASDNPRFDRAKFLAAAR